MPGHEMRPEVNRTNSPVGAVTRRNLKTAGSLHDRLRVIDGLGAVLPPEKKQAKRAEKLRTIDT